MDQEPLQIPRGFRASGVCAGIKPSGLPDVAVILSDTPCEAAGTFTTNRIAAAPVQWDRSLVPSGSIRAIIINAGNANAATGAQGLANARRTAELAASHLSCNPDQILLASTGIIGHQLPMDLLEKGLTEAISLARSDEEGFRAASEAILTTDTRPKVVSKQCTLKDGQTATLLGLAKGAAMIGPRMATMLGFLITDIRVPSETLQEILSKAVDDSFNCISVEGHTSTNDSVLILSASHEEVFLSGEDLETFSSMVREVCRQLARMIPEDGEGATHLITLEVEGCRSQDEAKQIARTVADSPLVKTAVHGADPNWGRILSAVGYAGIEFDEAEVVLEINGTCLFREGAPVDVNLAELSDRMRANRDVRIRITLQQGPSSTTFWTSDLTSEYVRLNADYTT